MSYHYSSKKISEIAWWNNDDDNIIVDDQSAIWMNALKWAKQIQAETQENHINAQRKQVNLNI